VGNKVAHLALTFIYLTVRGNSAMVADADRAAAERAYFIATSEDDAPR
jgi:hypothetical protein